MSDMNLIKELRALTSAGMKDCKDALEESNWDLQKAIDVVKIKGLNFADGRTGRVASEGRIDIAREANGSLAAMVEVNCQTDFVANNKDFINFVADIKHKLYNNTFSLDSIEDQRKVVVSTTKENVVVRRWHIEKLTTPASKVFAYHHSNNKIGVLITMQALSEEVASSMEFKTLGEDLAMQICAMSPLAVSTDKIPKVEKDRQELIFRAQLAESKSPEKMWDKIIEGKFRKWNTEVCLLEQESVVVAKTLVKKVIEDVGAKLGESIQVLSFIRFQVGEGIEKNTDNLAEEVAKMITPVEHGILR